jgi:hypothetical protein
MGGAARRLALSRAVAGPTMAIGAIGFLEKDAAAAEIIGRPCLARCLRECEKR